VARTEPYVFFSTQDVGITLSAATPDGGAVVGVDLALADLSDHLADQRITPGTELALVDARGGLVAHERVADLVEGPRAIGADPTLVALARLDVRVLASLAVNPVTTDQPTTRRYVDGRDWRVAAVEVPVAGGQPLTLLVAVPERELFAAALELRDLAFWWTLVIVLAAIPATMGLARAVARPLRYLAAEAEAIGRFEFEGDVRVRSVVLEVQSLAHMMDDMKRTIRRFLETTEAVAAERDLDLLLPMLLHETAAAAGARDGVLFLDGDGWRAAAVLQGGAALAPIDPPVVGPGPLADRLAAAALAREPHVGTVDDLDLASAGIDPTIAQGHREAVTVPLVNRAGDRLGALLLLRPTPIGRAQAAFVRALSGTATSTLETRELIAAQKRLFDAFIRLIAGAIDAKSRSTGGHCERVPALTQMLAQAAADAREGPYADFALDDDDWEALHIAAWLHDCGKVTTPEYVVDKATKLETLYDRIHEVRTRFEVLKRDAEVRAWRRIADGAARAPELAELDRTWRALEEDFAFVARCNLGVEALPAGDAERLRAIARRTFQRTLDDRLGTGRAERERLDRRPSRALPVEESVLADRPEHRIERGPADRVALDPRWGVTMPVPELRYDLGELHNLTVERGTLTIEERFKVQEHAVQTIAMLGQLPFPRHLQHVPEIAGGHHERVDGRGYPRGLTGDQMSPLARMLAIADVFEALTASDRPYKPAASLSQAIGVLAAMRDDGHVDPDLFELFLTSGAFRRYADGYLRPDQLDDVDVTRYLSGSGS
jgi:HD-GYP domain-containing protein (c-di-GMP phosphodiesterase class II)